MNIPTPKQAEFYLTEAEAMNPGPWASHNRVAANCAKTIAEKCDDIDKDTAYVLGLLHDVGRRFGICDMRHTLDGYNFMNEQGYDLCARICLTHSFPYKNIGAYNGECDLTEAECFFVQKYIDDTEYNDYDKLIQLCDAISFPSGPTYIEKRLVDVVIKRGFNDLTVPKWKAFLLLKEYFDIKTGDDIYRFLRI